ncbi:MAG TPA: hypothetical protein VEL28_21535 [Candidatus Binatia bacterium]|nr:hypothetical protein [Candidatus Binatia bacterium]
MAAALAATFATGASGGEPRTVITISTVLASNQSRNFDPKLVDLRSELRSLRFKSYRLVGSESRLVKGNGDQCGIELPNDRYLHITTRDHTADHLRMHVLLNEGNRPLINTDIKLEQGSVVLLGGPRGPDGTLIITIGAKEAAAEPKGRSARTGRGRQGSKAPVEKVEKAQEAAVPHPSQAAKPSE